MDSSPFYRKYVNCLVYFQNAIKSLSILLVDKLAFKSKCNASIKHTAFHYKSFRGLGERKRILISNTFI